MHKVHCMNVIAKVGTDQLGPDYELTDNVDEAEAILVRSAVLHEMEFSKNLLAVGRAGAGVNNIPLDRCAEQGIVVFNTPGANANAVKEMVIAGMLLSCRDINGGIEWVKANADDANIAKSAEKAKKQFAGTELAGKKMGVIGLGAIGAMVANTARQLGMKVMGYDPFLSIRYAWSLDRHVAHVTNLDDIFAECDYISIHVPANANTKGMIDAAAIAKMKDGVVFCNFARDALVDEEAMAAALESGHVRHYVTDFANPTTAKMKGAIVTPHLGASTEEAEDNCAIMAAKEIRDYIENGNIVNSVNYPEIDLGPIATDMRLAVFHKNIPSMIGQITSAVSEMGINIENMTDKSKGEYAYALLELSGANFDESAIMRLTAIDGIYRVRALYRK